MFGNLVRVETRADTPESSGGAAMSVPQLGQIQSFDEITRMKQCGHSGSIMICSSQ